MSQGEGNGGGGAPSEGWRQLMLPPGPLTAGLLEAFSRVLAYALVQETACGRDPERAVHEFRKSIRRARALVRLVRPTLRAEDFARIDGALREAVRDTSQLRDTDVILQGIARLTPHDPAAVATLRAGLLEEQGRHHRVSVRDALHSGAERLYPAIGLLARVLPTLDPMALERCLRESFRRSRRARAQAERTLAEEDIHRWRKRVKELRYQLELLGGRRSGPLAEAHTLLDTLAEELGGVTDLQVMRAYLRQHSRRIGRDASGAIRRDIAAAVDQGLHDAFGRSAPLFSLRPREFTRRLLGPGEQPPIDRG